MTGHPQRTRRAQGVALLACLLASLFSVAYPIYVVMPFRPQSARELAMALTVMRFQPVGVSFCAIAALAVLALYWRAQPRWTWRVLATACAGLACALAVLTRVNIYELMFHPDDHPAFAAVSQTKLDKDEKVIAVKLGGAARAYPIRNIAYHHVINDVLDKVAIVATY